MDADFVIVVRSVLVIHYDFILEYFCVTFFCQATELPIKIYRMQTHVKNENNFGLKSFYLDCPNYAVLANFFTLANTLNTLNRADETLNEYSDCIA